MLSQEYWVPPDPLPWWRVLTPLIVFLLLGIICRMRPVPLLQIIFFTCVAMIGYAMIQDQVSVRLCPEYFTIGHPPLAGVSNSTLLGIAWGFLGGFPGGIVLGIPIALSARLGSPAPLPAQSLACPFLAVLAGTALGTLIAGVSGWYNARVVNIAIGAPWDALIPHERHRLFFTVASAHFGTYLSAASMGLGLCLWILYQRFCLSTAIAPSDLQETRP